MRFLTNSNPYPCSEISSQIYGRKKIEEEIKDEIKESFLFGRNDFSFFFFFFYVTQFLYNVSNRAFVLFHCDRDI